MKNNKNDQFKLELQRRMDDSGWDMEMAASIMRVRRQSAQRRRILVATAAVLVLFVTVLAGFAIKNSKRVTTREEPAMAAHTHKDVVVGAKPVKVAMTNPIQKRAPVVVATVRGEIVDPFRGEPGFEAIDDLIDTTLVQR